MQLFESLKEFLHRSQLNENSSDLMQSFFSLMKTNNGEFKSEKQKVFLLSKCQKEKDYYLYTGVSYMSFGKSTASDRHTTWEFFLDETGVTKCTKYHQKSRKTETFWEKSEITKNKSEMLKIKKEFGIEVEKERVRLKQLQEFTIDKIATKLSKEPELIEYALTLKEDVYEFSKKNIDAMINEVSDDKNIIDIDKVIKNLNEYHKKYKDVISKYTLEYLELFPYVDYEMAIKFPDKFYNPNNHRYDHIYDTDQKIMDYMNSIK